MIDRVSSWSTAQSLINEYGRIQDRTVKWQSQISTGKVVSKRVSRKEITNSSHENVIDRKNAAKSAGHNMGAVIKHSTVMSPAPRSRAARSMLAWCSPIWL